MLLPLVIAPTLFPSAQAAPVLDCATPAVLDALAGSSPAPHRHALQAPDRLGADLPLPPGDAKEIYGSP